MMRLGKGEREKMSVPPEEAPLGIGSAGHVGGILTGEHLDALLVSP